MGCLSGYLPVSGDVLSSCLSRCVGPTLSCIHRDSYIERAESAAEHQADTKPVHGDDGDALGTDTGKALLLASDQTHHENA